MQTQTPVKKKKEEYKKLKKRLERLIGRVLEVVEDDNLRLTIVDRLMEVRRLFNGKKPSS